MPDAVVAVLADQQAAIRQLQDADGAAPNFTLVGPSHPAGEDFAHGAGRLPILEWDEGDGLADPHRAVPGAVEGEEGAALVFLGELLTGVENKVQHGDVRTQQNVALNRLGHQVRALAFVAGVFVGAGIGERPTVKGALLDVRKVVGDQVVAEFVALLHSRPEGVGAGVVAHPDRVAGAVGKNFVAAAVGVIAVDGGALRISARGDVGRGTGAHAEALAVAGEEQAARPVSATEALKRGNLLAGTGGHGLGIVLVPLDGFGLADVEVSILDGEAIGTVQPLYTRFALLTLKNIDGALGAASGIREQDFIARAEQHEAWNLEAFLVDLHLEAGRDAEFGAFGLRDHARPVVG